MRSVYDRHRPGLDECYRHCRWCPRWFPLPAAPRWPRTAPRGSVYPDGRGALPVGMCPPSPRSASHAVPAWSVPSWVREELTLARELYAAKGNELTAMPRLLDHMVLGAVVDAAGALRAPCTHGGGADMEWVVGPTSVCKSRAPLRTRPPCPVLLLRWLSSRA